MLKLLYKTLLVSVLSGSLLFLSFQINREGLNIKFNSVQAETLTTDGVNDGDMMATLTMLAAAVIVSRLVKCKMTTDMWIGAAGGLAFLGGEVAAAIKTKAVMKDLTTEIKRDKEGKVEQKQIEALEKLKESYEQANKTAGIKKTMQTVAAAAFAAAAISSYLQYTSETTAVTTCVTGLGTAAATCASTGATLSAAVYTAPLGALYIAGGVAAIAAGVSEEAAQLASSATIPSVTVAATYNAALITNAAAESAASVSCPIISPALAACGAIKALTATTRGICAVPPVVSIPAILGKQYYANINYTPMKPVSGVANFFKNMLISEAKADIFSPMGITSSAVVAYLLATSTTLGIKVDSFIYSPLNRAIIWGVLGGLAYVARSSTDKQMKKIDANIAKIDGVLNSMNALASSVHLAVANNPTVQQGIHNAGSVINPILNTDINLSAGGASLPCITGTSSGCPNFETPVFASVGVNGMSTVMQSFVSGLNKVTNGLNGKSKISGATMNDAQALGGQLNALSAELKKQQLATQTQLKASGSKINLEDEGNKFEASLKDVVKKELIKQKTTSGAILASISGGSSSTATDAMKNPIAAIPKANKPAFTMPTTAPAPAFQEPKLEKDASAEAAALESSAVPTAKTATLDDFDLKNNDITSNKDTSIFDVISNRYQKSYDKLFKKIK
jgi:hypothetical protein